jgi:hypothetical protein
MWTLKRTQHFLTLAALALVSVGCNNGSNEAAQPSGAKVATNAPSPTVPQPETAPAPSQMAPKPASNDKALAPATPAAPPQAKKAAVPSPSPPMPSAKEIKKQMAAMTKDFSKKLKIEKSRDWVASSMSAEELASKIGKAMMSMRDTSGKLYTLVETPQGQGGFNHELKIKDNHTYHIDFIVPQDRPLDSAMVANGQYRMAHIGSKWIGPVPANAPLPGTQASPTQLAKLWGQDFTRMIFQGLTDARDPWKPVVSAWLKGAGGYSVKVEERHIPYQGHDFFDYRLLAERNPEQAKKLGKSSIEIVVDGYRYIPVTIRSVETDKKGGNWKTMWTSHYKFKQKFTAADFVAPYNRELPKAQG